MNRFRFVIGLFLVVSIAFCAGCGGGGGKSSGTNTINISEYFPLKVGNSWSYNSVEGDYTWTVDSTTVKFGSVDVHEIHVDSSMAYYWTSDSNGLTDYGYRYSGELYDNNPPVHIPNGLLNGATGRIDSTTTYKIQKYGSYTDPSTHKTFDDTILLTSFHDGDIGSAIYAKGIGLIRNNGDSLNSWTVH